jgi:signal transduction histidine kinase
MAGEVERDDVESLRQQTIHDYQLDQLQHDPEFDHVSELVAELFKVPISAVTVLGRDQQLFHGACGLGSRTTARSDAFCNMTVQKDEVFVVEDAAADERFRDNALVTGEPFIRFYAGAPLRLATGSAVGSLCIIDRKPRTMSDEDRTRLLLLARTVSDLMELRIGSRLSEERQNALGRQAELLRATIDNVQQGLAVFDSEMKLALWNDRFFDLIGVHDIDCREGCPAEEILLRLARNGAFGDGEPSKIVEELAASVRERPSRRLELKGPDESTLLVWRASIPDGRFIVTIEDVTELRRVGRMKDEFISTVSHELRTPLTSIGGALAILNRRNSEALDAQGQQLLGMAVKNSDRLSALINDILDIEKLGSGSLSMKSEPVDLRSVANDACEQNRPFAVQHGVDLNLSVPSQPLRVTGDHFRLNQALTNLISNACKFSASGGVVEVIVDMVEGRARIRVRDQGTGIPAAFRSQIFRRFAQADPAHRKAGSVGTGLGLAITKAIVEKHGGSIGFDSQPGEGTCFWIHLPLVGESR